MFNVTGKCWIIIKMQILPVFYLFIYYQMALAFIIISLEGKVKDRKDEQLICHLELKWDSCKKRKTVLKVKITVPKIHKVIIMNEHFNDRAKQTEDKKVVSSSSCQVFTTKAG